MRYRAYILGAVLLAVALGQFCAAQERHMTGELVSGYSGADNNGDSLQGPYVGIVGDFSGYWQDPRILTFEVQPNLFHGFQWSGPTWGPETNGIAANSTFLGGSKIPLRISFSRQNIPSPDLGPQAGLEFQGISSMQQNFAVDWMAKIKFLPDLDVHYSRDNYSTTYPADFGGQYSNKDQDFRIGAGYTLLGWGIHGSFDRNNTSLGDAVLLTNGQTSSGGSQSQTETVSVSRPLPLQSRFGMDFSSTDSSLDMGTVNTDSKFQRASGYLNSRLTDRLTTNLQAAYVTSYADYARQQILDNGGGSNLFPGSPLLNYNSDYLNYGGGASFRVLPDLYVHGEYSIAQTLSNSAAEALGDTHTVSAGLNYSHKLFGGNFSTSYGASHSVMTYLVNQDSLMQTVTAAYSRPIVYGIQFSGSADATDELVNYTFSDRLRNYGINADLSRRVGGGWNVRGHIMWRTGNQSYPLSTSNGSKSLGLTATSKRLQLDMTEMIDSGLAYQFGNTVILVPGATPYANTPGLPMFFETSGNTFNLSAAYQATKRLSLRAMWRMGSRSINGADSLNAHGYDLRFDYRFRKVRLAGGYANSNQDLAQGVSAFYVRMFYIEVRRDFKLF
jgi:hypothetical protein